MHVSISEPKQAFAYVLVDLPFRQQPQLFGLVDRIKRIWHDHRTVKSLCIEV